MEDKFLDKEIARHKLKLLENAKKRVRHFKGTEYLIEDFAVHTETDETLVIYRTLYGCGALYARPLEMFASKVDKVQYPNATQTFRFELI